MAWHWVSGRSWPPRLFRLWQLSETGPLQSFWSLVNRATVRAWLGMAPTKNADCASAGTYGVCRNAKCVSLVSPLCTTVHTTNSTSPSTAYEDDSAVIFGASSFILLMER